MSKRMVDLNKAVDQKKIYTLSEALEVIKANAKAKFDETIDVSVNLEIDAKKTDQNIRGSLALPHGTGRTCRVAVVAGDDKAAEAKKAGAEIVGGEDLIEKITKGEINFDACIATPDLMAKMSKAARVLGPRGLMPNPKLGTVTNDVAAMVQSLKKGRVNFKNEKAGVVHAPVGKASFSVKQLQENIEAFLAELKNAKPTTVKGTYIKEMFISSTQGVSLMFQAN